MELSRSNQICFAKVKPNAIIPSKEKENLGYDIYACFDEEEMLIYPHETRMIPIGIASACDSRYGFLLQERGSTGTKGIAQRCGVIDSGYRGEWMCPITNTSDVLMIISKSMEGHDPINTILYPYTKAICQAIVIESLDMEVGEVSYSDLETIQSDRGIGKLGSTNK